MDVPCPFCERTYFADAPGWQALAFHLLDDHQAVSGLVWIPRADGGGTVRCWCGCYYYASRRRASRNFGLHLESVGGPLNHALEVKLGED